MVLRDSGGRALRPGDIAQADPRATCGGCHDARARTAALHFNRNSAQTPSEPAACFDCHVPQGKQAFDAGGAIVRVSTRPPEQTCLACHPEVDAQRLPPAAEVHRAMLCVDCHRAAGHQSLAEPSCRGCHYGKTGVPRPVHRGLPRLHLQRIACEACHVSASARRSPGVVYASRAGLIIPLDSDGVVIHHGVEKSAGPGCTKCHSTGRKSLLAGLAAQGVVGGWRVTRADIELGALREGVAKPAAPWAILVLTVLCAAHYVIFGPKRVKTRKGEPSVLRFSIIERLFHALLAGSFVFLAITGGAFLLRLDTPNGPWREIHGRVGALFAAGLIGVVFVWWRQARFAAFDMKWLKNFGGYLWRKEDCPSGKFNCGQKLFFWIVAAGCGAVVCATGFGLVIGGGSARSWVYALHDFAAIMLLLGVISHAYLGVLANPGAFSAIVTGRVPESWARRHHSEWPVTCQSAKKPGEHADCKH